MALSGTINGGWTGGARTRITWSGSQNIGDNYTNVTAKRYLDVDDTHWWYTIGDAGSNWLSINGSSSDTGKQNGTWHDGSYLIQTRTVKVNHNSDGTKSINISGKTYLYGGTQTSASATVSLNQIPRNAEITGGTSSFNDEQNPTINFSNPAGTAIDTLQTGIWKTDGATTATGYINVSQTASSYTFSLTEDQRNTLRSWLANAQSMTVRIYLRSVIGGNDERPYRNVTLTLKDGEPIFDDFVYQDTNATTAALTGDNQLLVQGVSTLRATIPLANKMTAQKYATPANYVTTVDGKTLTTAYSDVADVNVDVGVLGGSGALALAVRAVDSRAKSTTVSKNITVIPYAAPIITATAARLNGFEDTTTLKIHGTFSKITVGGTDKNAVVTNGVKYRISQDGGAFSSWVNATFSQGAGAFTAPDIYLSLVNSSTFVIEIQVTDALGVSTKQVNVGRGIPIMMISTSGSNVGVGKMPASGRALDVAGDIYAAGNRVLSTADMPTNGSNSNGSWTKFADGTMICTARIDISSTSGVTWTYPSAFISSPIVCAMTSTYTNNMRPVQTATPSASSVLLVKFNQSNARDTGVTDVIAIGRWK